MTPRNMDRILFDATLCAAAFSLWLILCLAFAVRERSSPKGMQVERLGVDQDGTAIYRFWDNGKYHYYVAPEGPAFLAE